METGTVDYGLSHVSAYDLAISPQRATEVAESIAADLDKNKAIFVVFDEFCMAMYNATIPDELLFKTGVYKEQLSQSTLYAEMRTVNEAEAQGVFDFLLQRGFNFHFGEDDATELTKAQVIEQCKMYIAACRIGDRFGCDAIGIQ